MTSCCLSALNILINDLVYTNVSSLEGKAYTHMHGGDLNLAGWQIFLLYIYHQT